MVKVVIWPGQRKTKYFFRLFAGEVIKHKEMRVIPSEGMPLYKSPFDRGDLLIQFSVQFPKHISKKHFDRLNHLIPGRSKPHIPDDAEVNFFTIRTEFL